MGAIMQFLVCHNGSVLHADDHIDRGRELFPSRLEWDWEGFDTPITAFDECFKPVADSFQIKYHLVLSDHRPKVAILVSAYDIVSPTCCTARARASLRVTSSPSSAVIAPPAALPSFTEFRFICSPIPKIRGPANSKSSTCWARMWTLSCSPATCRFSARNLLALPAASHQHPSLFPAGLRRRPAVSPGLRARG